MAGIVAALRSEHVIPILFAPPPRLDNAAADVVASEYNEALFELARNRRVLLVNFWRALEGSGMVEHGTWNGMWTDGVHPSTADDEGSIRASAFPIAAL